ncbi:hypothetical protein BTN49_3130 [Candidatus Enterovibrio escicola]|uniref:Uncharacterized protein n=1 Tax=Candidatus Enterovibrio escicola TaxID=1927127 RepID=A0A2A5SZA9_9GAMM|nr:hypothetical protein BTN49_3130 [Candidatus Enterovibrio escacola]
MCPTELVARGIQSVITTTLVGYHYRVALFIQYWLPHYEDNKWSDIPHHCH